MEAVEACEIAVEGADAGAVLDGQCREVGVGNEIPAQISVDEEPSEDVAVAVSRCRYPGLVCIEPVGDVAPRIRRRQGFAVTRGWVMTRWNASSETHGIPTRSTPFIASSNHVRAAVWKWDRSSTA